MSTKFTALTIKQGDAFLLEDNGWNCLFDSGFDKSIVELLKFRGINKLNLAICSHNDADHANGFISLLESDFQIDEIWLPGLWASVLQFAKENGISDKDIECDDEYYNGELESLFSVESVRCDSFNQGLSYWNKLKQSNKSARFYNRLHGKIVDYIHRNPGILAQLLAYNLQNQFKEEDPNKEKLVDYLEDQWMKSNSFISARGIAVLANRITRYQDLHSISMDEWKTIAENLMDVDENRIKGSLNIKLNKIMEIVGLAHKHGCAIRWFEPTSSSCSTKQLLNYGMVALNSRELFCIKMPKNCMAYLCMLMLTNENKYSLVFEYTKKEVPIVRFSADSNSTCQSVSPYTENIIVTAPHHGSNANAIVYGNLTGNDIIWVRSDWRSSKRPCSEFKSQPNKYCLACDKFNFVSEICFEYSTSDQKWHYIRGEQCRCK